jgi:predicted porin
MKKTLIALAAVAAVGGASAQVSIYGTVDAAVTQYSSEGNSRTGLGNSQLGSSKLGFSGVEDLGGGMNAIFKLEGGLANDSGVGKAANTSNQAANGGAGSLTSVGGTQGLVFGRYAYVGASGGFGEVRLGRDYTNTFLFTVTTYDVFGTNGPADSSAMTLNLAARNSVATSANASNMVGYASPSFGGLRVRLQSFFGENTSNASNAGDGDGYSAQVGYAAGPLSASVGQQQTKGTAKAATTTTANTGTGAVTAATLAQTGNYTQTAVGASYDFGMAKVMFLSTREELIGAQANSGPLTATSTNVTNMIGLNVPVGAMNYKLSYASASQNSGVAGAKDNTGTLTGLGMDYALSKRTKLYGTYSTVTNDGGKAYSAAGVNGAAGTTVAGSTPANPSSSGLALGVFHTF